MVNAIQFNNKNFKTEDDYNLISPMTENTIIICNNYKIMDSLAEETCNTINGKAEYNNYDCDDSDVGNAKIVLRFGLQRVIDINGQHITLALEPSIVYKAKEISDMWFFDWSGGSAGTVYQELIYPMNIFKGSQEIWNNGLDEVYKIICNGRYGTYDGKWVNLGEDDHDRYRNTNCI